MNPILIHKPHRTDEQTILDNNLDILGHLGGVLICFSISSIYTQRQMAALEVFHGLELAVTIMWRLSLE